MSHVCPECGLRCEGCSVEAGVTSYFVSAEQGTRLLALLTLQSDSLVEPFPPVSWAR